MGLRTTLSSCCCNSLRIFYPSKVVLGVSLIYRLLSAVSAAGFRSLLTENLRRQGSMISCCFSVTASQKWVLQYIWHLGNLDNVSRHGNMLLCWRLLW